MRPETVSDMEIYFIGLMMLAFGIEQFSALYATHSPSRPKNRTLNVIHRGFIRQFEHLTAQRHHGHK